MAELLPHFANGLLARVEQTNSAPAQLLATKLFVPQPRVSVVRRPHLVEQLTAGLQGKLTLISAPAGSGKTMLVSEWRASPAGSAVPLAWVSLDGGDTDPLHFWTYVCAALTSLLDATDLTVGRQVLGLLNPPQLPPIETILVPLLNALSQLPRDAVLVLDDYHIIDSIEIHQAFVFLLDHLPPRLHLMIMTRADPPLPLSRLRARGDLKELRAADLRFTS